MKTWVNFKKIGNFFSCPLRYKKLYLSGRSKGSWTPNSNIENLKKNIVKIFKEKTKFISGRKPNAYDNIDFQEGKLNEDSLKEFQGHLELFQNEHKLSDITIYSKPLFLGYNDNIGLFTNIDFTIRINSQLTAVILEFYGYQKSKDTIGDNREHFFNSYVINEKIKDVKNILYIYPNFNNILLVPINKTDIEQGKKDVENFIFSLNNSDFKSKAGGFCDYCDFQEECPSWKGYPFELSKEKRRELFRLSYSKLDVFKRCPFSYKKIYVEKIPQRSRDFFSVGTTIHSVMEEVEQLESQPTKDEIHELYFKHWQSKGFIDETDEAKQKDDAWVWFKKYLEEMVLNPFKKALYTELYFQFSIEQKVMFNGFIDRIDRLEDGTYEIIDYKTEDSLRSQDEVDNDMQLSAYFWAAKKLGMNVSKLSLHFVRFQKIVSTTRTMEDINKFENTVSHWTDKILSEEDYLPKENKYCNHCDFRDICPLFKK